MTGVQIASSGMVSQFFAIVSSDEKLPEQGEELLPEPFPGGNVPGILPEAPAVPAPATDVSQVVEDGHACGSGSCQYSSLPDAGFWIWLDFLEAEASPMKCQAAAPVLLSGKTIQNF